MPPDSETEHVITRSTRVELALVIVLVGAIFSFGWAASEFSQLREDVNALTAEVVVLKSNRLQIDTNTRDIAALTARFNSIGRWTRDDQKLFCARLVAENPGVETCPVD